MEKRNTIQKQLVLDAVAQLADHPTADEVDVYKRQIFNIGISGWSKEQKKKEENGKKTVREHGWLAKR